MWLSKTLMQSANAARSVSGKNSEMVSNACRSTFDKRIHVLVLLSFNVLVNNFSVMSGRSHRFLDITSTFGE